MASRVQLYVDLGSQPSRAVLWLTKLLSIPTDVHALRLDKGDTRTEEFLKKIHPQGRVPAVVYEGESFIESSAIMMFLCDKFEGGERFYPKDLKRRFHVNSYLCWHHEFRAGAAGYFAGIIMGPVVSNKAVPEDRIKKAEMNLDKVLGQLERYWLNGSLYIGGATSPTIADLQCINELNQVVPFYPACVDKYPHVQAWVSRMEAVPHYTEMITGWKKVVGLLKGKYAKL